ncbi:hypothetical protein, partial [Desulfosporosinus sp. FKA]|uniref:hypothetical protein n=1 Tax=Desulfosporosinus sp. FKA TaxID=1969834 RepID=UPI001A9A62BB
FQPIRMHCFMPKALGLSALTALFLRCHCTCFPLQSHPKDEIFTHPHYRHLIRNLAQFCILKVSKQQIILSNNSTFFQAFLLSLGRKLSFSPEKQKLARLSTNMEQSGDYCFLICHSLKAPLTL